MATKEYRELRKRTHRFISMEFRIDDLNALKKKAASESRSLGNYIRLILQKAAKQEANNGTD